MRWQRLGLCLSVALAAVVPSSVHAAVTPGQVDEFNLFPTSTYGWTNDAGGDGIENIAQGGPDTTNPNDHFLQISAGNLGGQGDLTTYSDAHWLGNFSNIAGIRVDLKNLDTNVPAQAPPIRFAIREYNGFSDTPGYATNAYMLQPGDWNKSVFFPFTALTMTGFNDPQPLATDLANVGDFRLLASADPAGVGDNVFPGARIGVDNITAVPKGDWNQDGTTDVADIQAMLNALTDLSAYEQQKGLDPTDVLAIGDLNADGVVNNLDIQPLLDLLGGAGLGSVVTVPEPAALVPAVWALATLGLLLCRRRLKLVA